MSVPSRLREGLALLILVLLGGLACSSSSSDGEVPGGPCLQFTPASAPAPGTVATVAPGGGCDSIELELRISDVSDVFAVSFTVGFDPSVLQFDGLSTAGSLLESGNVPLDRQVGGTSGMVTIGVTRIADDGIDAVGAANLVTLRFLRASALGTTSVDYTATRIFGSETPPEEKQGIIWTGGTVQIL